jgi:cytochrome P450
MAAESQRFCEEVIEGTPLNINRAMKELTLSIVGSTLFGRDFHENTHQIAGIIQRVIRRSAWIAPASALFEPLVRGYRRLFPRAPSLFFPSERKRLEQIVDPIINERRTTQTQDVLSLLLQARDDVDRPLDNEAIRNELITLVLAGHETTATALTWTWYLLSDHPAVEEKLVEELEDVIGDREINFDDLPKLTYANMVFKEALRLYPPALAFGRRPLQRVELGGYPIPEGSTIMLSPYVTHRNEKYFPEPTRFS